MIVAAHELTKPAADASAKCCWCGRTFVDAFTIPLLDHMHEYQIHVKPLIIDKQAMLYAATLGALLQRQRQAHWSGSPQRQIEQISTSVHVIVG